MLPLQFLHTLELTIYLPNPIKQELQIDYESYDHPVVLTVEAQAKYVGHLGGALSKNLLLKDKKHRFYVISALADTNIDLKVLSQRLGLGKGGLRMAPEESLKELLQVPLGCVTPFALINESAGAVLLLLDQGFRSREKCFFHPLSNDMTISLSSSNVEKFLASIGRKTLFVDLEANPRVGKDNPPDLADLVLSDISTLSNQFENAVSVQNPVPVQKSNTTDKIEHQLASVVKDTLSDKKSIKHTDNAHSKKSKSIEEKPKSITDSSLGEAANVSKFVSEIIDKTTTAVLAEINKANDQKYETANSSVAEATKKQITSDLESLAMMLKNAAYTQGFHAGSLSVLPQKYW